MIPEGSHLDKFLGFGNDTPPEGAKWEILDLRLGKVFYTYQEPKKMDGHILLFAVRANDRNRKEQIELLVPLSDTRVIRIESS